MTKANRIEDLDVANARSIISCITKNLKEVLEFLLRAVPKGKMRGRYMCEMTVKTNEVDFVVIGAQKALYCKASGPAKASVPIIFLYNMVCTVKTYNCLILLSDGFMKLESSTFSVNTFFFHDDSILRSINLPINYRPNHVLNLKNQYTPEELLFNDLDNLVEQAYMELENDIWFVFNQLSKYGFKKDEIVKILNDKIFVNQLNSDSNDS